MNLARSGVVISGTAHSTAEIRLAVGVLSHVSKKNVARRDAVRKFWLPHKAAAVRFVIRCAGLAGNHSVIQEAAAWRDVACAPVSAHEGRTRGAPLALLWWLEYALQQYPQSRWIAKADDDTFLSLPSIHIQLNAIAQEAVAYSWYGHFGYLQMGLDTTVPALSYCAYCHGL